MIKVIVSRCAVWAVPWLIWGCHGLASTRAPEAGQPFTPRASQLCTPSPKGPPPPAKEAFDPQGTFKLKPVTVDAVRADLEGKSGLVGFMPGAAQGNGHFVLNVGSTLVAKRFNLVAQSDSARTTLATLRRHDKVKVRGRLLQNSSPAYHIGVQDISLLEAWRDGEPTPPHAAAAPQPRSLPDSGQLLVVAHAVPPNGGALVVDYDGMVLPIIIRPEHDAAARQVYRGDKLLIDYTIQRWPERPLHLITHPQVPQAIRFIDRIVNCEGLERELEGVLVKFPRSPQINRDVFALQRTDANGLVRNWTLVNFEDPEVFNHISRKLANAWNQQVRFSARRRNQLVNSKIHIVARGELNVQSPNQANPQILLASPHDLTLRVAR